MPQTGFHIVILCSRLDLPGGIERAVVNTANLFHSKGQRVSLLVLDETAESFYPVSPGISVLHISLSFGITATGNPVSRKFRMLSDVLKLRRILKQIHPSVVIASEYPFAAALVLTGLRKKCKLVSWEHHHFNELEKNAFWEKVFRFTYPRLHQIVCLNPDEKELYSAMNPDTVVIPNFADPVHQAPGVENSLILTIARLNHVKGIDLLIRIAEEVLTKNPGWQWKLIGHGRMDDFFKEHIGEKGLHERLVIQEPAGHDLSEEYNEASFFVLTSRNECFPMTLLEAMSHGLPCIAFDCETGPRHIIQNGINGNLVMLEDTNEMVKAINGLINDPVKRKIMSENAIGTVKEFSAEKIYDLWENKVLSN